MKDILHKLSLGLLFIYISSVYICSFTIELNPISQALFIMLFAITFFYVALRGSVIISKGIYFHVAFLFLIILSCYWIMENFTATQRFSTIFFLILIAVIINNVIIDEKLFGFLARIIYFAGIAMCLYSLLFYGYEGTMEALSEDATIRLGSEINEANIFGMICALTSSIGLYFAYHENKGIYYIISLIPITYTIASGSRMSVLIVVVAALILVITKKGKNTLSTIFIWILSAVVIMFIVNLLSNSNLFIFKRFELFFNIFNDDMVGADGSSITRFNMMKDGTKWFLQKPILGYGTDQYGILYFQNYGAYRYSHSNIIEVLVNHGFIGFLVYYGLYIYITVYVIKAVRRNLPYATLVLSMLGAVMVANVFFVMLYLKPTYILIGFFLAYITIHKKVLTEPLAKKSKEV